MFNEISKVRLEKNGQVKDSKWTFVYFKLFELAEFRNLNRI